jgi:hypothetical protein
MRNYTLMVPADLCFSTFIEALKSLENNILSCMTEDENFTEEEKELISYYFRNFDRDYKVYVTSKNFGESLNYVPIAHLKIDQSLEKDAWRISVGSFSIYSPGV